MYGREGVGSLSQILSSGNMVPFFSRLVFLQIIKGKCLLVHPPLHYHGHHHDSNPFNGSLLWDYCISILSGPYTSSHYCPFILSVVIWPSWSVKTLVIPTTFGIPAGFSPGSQGSLHICLFPFPLALTPFISSLQQSLGCSVCCSSDMPFNFLPLLLLILWLHLFISYPFPGSVLLEMPPVPWRLVWPL